MKYKYFLFDWDGTLGDSLPIWVPEFIKLFKEYGIEVTPEDVGTKVIANWEGPAQLGVSDVKGFFKRADEVLTPQFPEVKLCEGAREVLKKIKVSGGKVAVVTTSKREWILPAINRLGLESIVDVFLGKEDVTKYKPDPEILLKAMKLLGGEESECLVIGDHERDIEAAQAAGMDCVLYYPKRYEQYYPRDLQLNLGATHIIENFFELEKFL